MVYCSPKGFRELEANDDFNEKHVKALMEKWSRRCGIGDVGYVYSSVCSNSYEQDDPASKVIFGIAGRVVFDGYVDVIDDGLYEDLYSLGDPF